MEYYNRSVEQILADFKTSRDGLSYSQAQRRLEEYGPNRFSKGKSVTKLEIFFSQFNNPLIFILLLAFGVTAYLRDWSDLITIGAAVLIMPFIQLFIIPELRFRISRQIKPLFTKAQLSILPMPLLAFQLHGHGHLKVVLLQLQTHKILPLHIILQELMT